jgi:hypothetical protein
MVSAGDGSDDEPDSPLVALAPASRVGLALFELSILIQSYF